MDNRTFISRLAKATDTDQKTAGSLAACLSEIIGQAAAEMDSTAIPGFGTFEPEKTIEHVLADPQTGKRTLMPPSISIHFKPGSRLRKTISKA